MLSPSDTKSIQDCQALICALRESMAIGCLTRRVARAAPKPSSRNREVMKRGPNLPANLYFNPTSLDKCANNITLQCDEAHPMCRNCQKSKRECLGYDPIFKQQPGPAQIQPAPNSAPAPHSTTPAATPAAPSSATYSQSPVPQGYAPASSSGYAPAASATSGAHPSENFNAIDPALAAPQGQVMHQGQPHYNGVHPTDPAMRGPPGAAYPHPPPMMPPTRGKYPLVALAFPAD
jgi:hypothetical protein